MFDKNILVMRLSTLWLKAKNMAPECSLASGTRRREKIKQEVELTKLGVGKEVFFMPTFYGIMTIKRTQYNGSRTHHIVKSCCKEFTAS